jgi:hypothetical protein
VTLAETIAIAEARPAQAMFDAGAAAIDTAALTDIVGRKQAAQRLLRRRRSGASCASLLWGALAATAIAGLMLWNGGAPVFETDRWLEDAHRPAVGTALALGFFAGLAAWFASLWRAYSIYPVDGDADLVLAHRLLDGVAREGPDLARLLARARSGERFILYLRTFRTETAAQTRAEAESDALLDNAGSFMVDGLASPAFTVRHNNLVKRAILKGVSAEWDTHVALIRALARRAPVLCLGNLRLAESKHDELRAMGVEQAVLVKADWWSVLVELADRAATIVVFVSAETESVDRELLHLAASGKGFILVSTPGVNERMASSETYRRAVSSPGARQVLLDGEDTKRLEALLDHQAER